METWTIQKILAWTAGHFAKNGIESPKTDAELLLAHVLGVSRIQLIIDGARPLNASEIAAYKALIIRRSAREPIAYILGKREFWSLPLTVTPSVLIPRPDTECLVERVLEFIEAARKDDLPAWLKPAVSAYSCEAIDEKRAYYEAIERAEAEENAKIPEEQPDNSIEEQDSSNDDETSGANDGAGADAPESSVDDETSGANDGTGTDAPESHSEQKCWRIADVGTGSGAIALALASELMPEMRKIAAIDVSPEALAVAEKNSKDLGLCENVFFVQSDLFENPSVFERSGCEKFDIIASNPPYISQGEMATLMPEVKREPVLALEAGADGLDVYRRLVSEAYRHLRDGGLFIAEIGCAQGAAVSELFRNAGFEKVVVLDDYAHLPRNVAGVRQNSKKSAQY